MFDGLDFDNGGRKINRNTHPMTRNTSAKSSVNLAGSTNTNPNNIKGKGKGKAIPLQSWTVPEGSRRLRLPDFKTIGT